MYTQEDVKKVQKRLLKMAIVIRDILEKHNIPYFITYGTLLGAVRHHGFIPWDDDFDFYLFDDSYDQALTMLRQELPKDLFLEYFDSEPKYFHGWAHVKDLHSYTECYLFPQDGAYEHKGICIDLYKAMTATNLTQKKVLLEEHLNYLERRYVKGLIDYETKTKREESIRHDIEIENQKIAASSQKEETAYAMPSLYNDTMLKREIFPLQKIPFENTAFYAPKEAQLLLERCYHDYMTLPPIEKRHPHYSLVKFV